MVFSELYMLNENWNRDTKLRVENYKTGDGVEMLAREVLRDYGHVDVWTFKDNTVKFQMEGE